MISERGHLQTPKYLPRVGFNAVDFLMLHDLSYDLILFERNAQESATLRDICLYPAVNHIFLF